MADAEDSKSFVGNNVWVRVPPRALLWTQWDGNRTPDVFSSADRRLCAAASSAGIHVANPVDAVVSAVESLATDLGHE